ncbi:hypothetical protein [Streptosporangium roseum]|uniref:hypothetical protein n=1 Tax=Streptosporangium roseum TaxID=2001 RepID=UPI003332B0F8
MSARPLFARSAATAALSLAVLAGCGSQSAPQSASGPAAATPGPSSGTPDDRRIQQIKADCMKQKGFSYIPFVAPPQKQTELERKVAEGDYEATRELRAKYGFQVFAAHVYPDDTASGALVLEAFVTDPNEGIRRALNRTQAEVHREAEDVCFIKAVKEVLHKDTPSRLDYLKQRVTKTRQIRERELDGDPGLVELAMSFGDCLKAKGYPVPSLKPTALAVRGMDAFREEEGKLGPDDSGSVPDLTPAQARPYLTREIKAALDDLECGKDFYASYWPKDREIGLRVEREFGQNMR